MERRAPGDNTGTARSLRSPWRATTVLHSFDGTDGEGAFSKLLLASNGLFYGTTESGGSTSCGLSLCGTVFRMSGTGGSGLPRSSTSRAQNGSYPEGGLLEGGDGYLYGITSGGGSGSSGTFFRMSLSGKLSTTYNFWVAPCTDGYAPNYGLVQLTNGLFYGIAASGEDGNSVVYSVDSGLEASLWIRCRLAGKVGANVRILGNNLTGATAVSFNGTDQPAFTVVSATEIRTIEPRRQYDDRGKARRSHAKPRAEL